jgi:uncharacterized protein YkwD
VPSARKITVAVAAVLLWALVGASGAAATDCPNAGLEANALTTDQMETSIGCLINAQRTSYGLQPVQPNSDLRQAALSHSDEMVQEGYFEHTSPAGVTFIDRIEQTGYMRNTRSWVVGENLVWGTGSWSTPDALVTAWMNSPPHRENLLRPSFREIGIAAVIGTPESSTETDGVTVSSEYGYRTFDRKLRASKARAHKSKRSRRHHHKRHHRHGVKVTPAS